MKSAVGGREGVNEGGSEWEGGCSGAEWVVSQENRE